MNCRAIRDAIALSVHFRPFASSTQRKKMTTTTTERRSEKDVLKSDVVATAAYLADIYIDDCLNDDDRDAIAVEPSASAWKRQTASRRFARKFVFYAHEVERRYDSADRDMFRRTPIRNRNVVHVFDRVVKQLFETGINWGRIVALYAFGGALARQCVALHLYDFVPLIKRWIVRYVERNLAEWIVSKSGWEGCDRHFRDFDDDVDKGALSWGLLGLAAVGITIVTFALTTK